MKGISPFIAFVLVAAISVASTALILRSWDTSLDKTRGYATINEARGIMNGMNSAVKEVSAEGEGSSRKIDVGVSGGEYRVSASADSVTFVLENREELFSEGPRTEGDLLMEVYQNNTVSLKLEYDSVDIVTDLRWSGGSHNILVRNNGTSAGKVQIVFNMI